MSTVFFIGYCAGVLSSTAGAIVWEHLARKRSGRERGTT